MPRPTLAEHITECELRYQELNRRLTSVENKLDHITNLVDDFKMFFVRLSIRAMISLAVIIASAVFVIKI